ncbi:polysaccharide biosynthesis tyrosine autokinase [filamentous cyanobacterium LEGE 11480]|uniref:non-specific protein-tyrosine kinase n=2 Tax=Romeriopsis TaxID=2992131 RepID=A0A928Z3W9_9CYAN|nr:polysaccharide biosynthesis tyrosine autokinase [Romeriopsis navalis LEGE 11480]
MPDAIEPVDFQQYWLVVKRRWKPAAVVFVATVAAATALSSQQKPSYTSSGKLVLRTNRIPSLTGVGSESGGGAAGALGSLNALTQQSSPLRTEAENILSRPVLERTVKALNLRDMAGQLVKAEDLAAEIKVKEVPGADVLKVTYTDGQRDRAAKVVNQLLQQYIKTNVDTTRLEARAAREFIDQELPKAKAAVQQVDAALRQFKERSQIVDLGNEQQMLSTSIGAIENQITQAGTELTEVNARYIALRQNLKMDTQQALAASSLSQSTGVQQAASQWQQLQSELQLERTRLQDGHPRIQNLLQKEQTLRQLLRQRMVETIGTSNASLQSLAFGEVKQSLVKEYLAAEMRRGSLANRLKALKGARIAYRRRLSVLPQLEQQQRELKRRLDVAQSTYASLMGRLQEVQLAERQTVGTASIVENAIPASQPGGSSKVMFLGVGVLLGSLLASATMLGLELADRSIKTVKEAKELFGYSCLGTIPYWGNPRQAKRHMGLVPGLPVREMPRSLVSAAYRMVQANLRFVNIDSTLKSVVVTSSVPKEGKSTVAANLAATMAQLGRRVLLIDADLHHPTQHRIWAVDNQAGLSDLIVGQVSLRQAVQPAMQNLDVLPAGVMPPNPLAILDSHRMAKLVKGLETVYDMVIIDSPPLVVEAEALTLGRLAQGTMLVARPGVLPAAAAKAAKELLTHSGQSVFGMVINSAVLEPEPYRHTDYNRDYYSRKAVPMMA